MIADPAPVFSVANLWEMIEGSLEPLMTSRFRLRGTIQDVAVRRHLYCSLADRTLATQVAKVNTVIFAADLARIRSELLSRGLGELESDVEVVAVGRLSTYRPAGRVSFVVEHLDYDEMRRLGRLDVERLRAALIEEGLFGANKDRPLAAVPLRIAVVTSEAGTVQHDFTRVLARSGYRFSWQLYSTRVTGTQAADELAAMVKRADADGHDLIVLLRGGGSESELALFNTEAVVRSVVNAETPVWCAIGHAADDVLVNEVAHRALDVPQSVATALVERVEDYLLGLEHTLGRAVELIAARLRDEQAHRRSMAARVIGSCHAGLTQLRVGQAEQWASLVRLAEGRCRGDGEEVRRLSQSLRSNVRLRLAHELPRLLDQGELAKALQRRLESEASDVGRARVWLETYDPRKQLQLGYAIVQGRSGRWLTTISDVMDERLVTVLMRDGSAKVRLEEGEVQT